MIGQWLSLALIGPIRATTILSAIAVFLIVLYRTRRVSLAFISTIAWAAVYETIWTATNSLMHGASWSTTAWIAAALIAWPLLARAKEIRPNKYLLIAFVGVWIVWIVAGFNYNSIGQPFIAADEFLNVMSKSLMAAAYALT